MTTNLTFKINYDKELITKEITLYNSYYIKEKGKKKLKLLNEVKYRDKRINLTCFYFLTCKRKCSYKAEFFFCMTTRFYNIKMNTLNLNYKFTQWKKLVSFFCELELGEIWLAHRRLLILLQLFGKRPTGEVRG